jgi:SAM-dependent methyltransferase
MKRLDRTLQRMRIQKVRPFVGSSSRVLDIGCFDGTLADQLGPFDSYTGVDPEAPASSVAPRRRFIRGTFPNDSVPAESFDVITALAVLEHVPSDQQKSFAERCFEALVPSGRLVITVPSPLVDPILDVLRALRVLDGMETEQHYGFKPADTHRIFGSAGFVLEKHERFELGLNELFVFQRPAAVVARVA